MLEDRIEQANNLKRELKVALINPPSLFLTDDKIFVPLGILNIATILKLTKHKVFFFDLAGKSDYLNYAKEIAQDYDFDIIGITATSPQFVYAYNILKVIKQYNKEVRVVIGGVHASIFYNYYIQKKNLDNINFKSIEEFDQIVAGEEFSAFKILESNDKYVTGGLFNDFKGLPYTNRDLVDFNSYLIDSNYNAKFKIYNGPTTNINFQRGCPYSCTYCSTRNLLQYRKIRSPSLDKILNEIEYIGEKWRVFDINITDDELNLNYNKTRELLLALEDLSTKRIIRNKQPFNFRAFIKSELLVRYPDTAFLLQQAGFKEVLVGVESGSDRILMDHIKKHTTRKVNLECCRLLFQNNIRVKVLTMMGFPTETLEDILETRSFLEEVNLLSRQYKTPYSLDITLLTPYPGSFIYDNLKNNTGEFKKEFKKTFNNGDLLVKEMDFAKDETAYKTAQGKNVANVRTLTLSAESLVYYRDKISTEIQEKIKN